MGINLVNISQNSLKHQSGHLNINPEPCAKYQNPSSSHSQDVDVVLLFYIHGKNLRSCRDGQLT